jgi:hypothetical protein
LKRPGKTRKVRKGKEIDNEISEKVRYVVEIQLNFL